MGEKSDGVQGPGLTINRAAVSFSKESKMEMGKFIEVFLKDGGSNWTRLSTPQMGLQSQHPHNYSLWANVRRKRKEEGGSPEKEQRQKGGGKTSGEVSWASQRNLGEGQGHFGVHG